MYKPRHVRGGWLCFCLLAASVGSCEAAGLFTVADDIELITFGSPESQDPRIRFSPDRKYVAVWSERGRIETNQVEDTLRVYRTHDIESLLKQKESRGDELQPFRLFTRGGEEAPVIGEWRWLADSSGLTFSQGAPYDCKRVYLYEVEKGELQSLTDPSECVGYYDVRDKSRFVYSTAIPPAAPAGATLADKASVVGTGQALNSLLFPLGNPRYQPADAHVVAAIDGRRALAAMSDGAPIVRIREAKAVSKALVLSPDGRTVITGVELVDVPADWPSLYLPPFPNAPFRVQVGRPADRFMRIDMETGRSEPLLDAPTADAAAWWQRVDGWSNQTTLAPLWSRDSSAVLVPGVFLPAADGTPSRPCVAVVEIATKRASCVHRFETPDMNAPSKVARMFRDMSFVDGDPRSVRLKFALTDGTHVELEYRQGSAGKWVARGAVNPKVSGGELTLHIKEGLDEPPVVVAESGKRSRVIWDPNPHLKQRFDLGRVEVYRWKTPEGREWSGGLYTPPQAAGTKPFPLVIQTHGFDAGRFAPSGWEMPSGFAARELQAAGIVVLQVNELCTTPSFDEAACAVAGYESAVRQLTAEGLIDPRKTGIIGFSRTCIYVMNALTQSKLPLAAAIVTDGLMTTYVQQILMAGVDTGYEGGFHPLIGAAPFGDGLNAWRERSPSFNLDRVQAPLRVVGHGNSSLLHMWEVYAGLRYLQKPTDLVLLRAKVHNPLNPGVRLASQGGTVDWFRFWLEKQEDPAAEKAAQYQRWRALAARMHSGRSQ